MHYVYKYIKWNIKYQNPSSEAKNKRKIHYMYKDIKWVINYLILEKKQL